MNLKYFNYHIIFSYLGLVPFILAIFDIHFFNIFYLNIIKDFIIYYNLLIFTFIGAMRWSFKNNQDFIEILCGFIPSLLSTIILILNLIKFNQSFIFFIICLLLFIQLLIDFSINENKNKEFFFYRIRAPLTLVMIIFNLYIVFI